VLHFSPGGAQIPQLALQQTIPTLHVDMPQVKLIGISGAPAQGVWSQVSPGLTQIPQLMLQQT
jgi:hypothetical protein